jgi:hypothetical protein
VESYIVTLLHNVTESESGIYIVDQFVCPANGRIEIAVF